MATAVLDETVNNRYFVAMPAMSRLIWISLAACACLKAAATPELKFDVATFCCHCDPDKTFCQPQFDHLNWPTTNGHFLAMGTDDHRLELATNGNVLAVYYDTFNAGYSTNSAITQASNINYYAVSRFTSTGPRPDWIVLNEISTSLWQNDSAYRVWAAAVVRELKTNYGFNVILFSPFATVAANGTDWQAVSANAWIGIENYLDGAQIKANGYSVSWCQSQYQSSITAYTNRGVPLAKLMLGEHFGQTVAGTGWGRSGIASNEWDQAIAARSKAAINLAFTGYLTYSWGGNGMMVSDDEMVHFEDTYRTNPLPYLTPVTAPYIILQPQSQTLPQGSDATLLVYRAGIGPMTFQWRFKGTNLAGATSSSLSLTNISVANHGTYSVVLSNSAGTLLSSNGFLNVSVPPAMAYEPFAPAVTAYAAGDNLIGQTNAAGQRWTQAGPDAGLTNQPLILGGNLNGGGLAGVRGNSVKFGGNGTSARFNLGTNSATGSWYFSLLARLTDITGLSGTGVFWAGYTESSGAQSSTPTVVGTRVITKAAAGGYQIGLDKNRGLAGLFVFDPTVYTTNDTLLLVGCYTFNPGSTTNDVSELWINPPAGSFGLATAPPPNLTSTVSNDLSQIASFVLFNRNAAQPAQIIADEIRIGQSWASVTPPAAVIPPPVLNTLQTANNLALRWSTNAEGYLLETTSDFVSGPWSPVIGPVYDTAPQYAMTNGIGGTSRYYRLNQPQ